MYDILLLTHSWWRWLVVAAAVFMLVRIAGSLFGKKEWNALDQKSLSWFAISLDIQLLLGLVLYIVSPLMQSAMGDMGAAMRDSNLRFFAVEHVTVMLLAVIVAHVGVIQVKKAPVASKAMRAAIWMGVAVLMIAWAIPWAMRPLFRI